MYRRKDGNGWEGFIEAGRHPGTGKRQRIKRTGKNKAEVVRKLHEARESLAAGISTSGRSPTVASFLDHWLDTVVAARVGAGRTVADYRRALDHVTEGLGAIPLAKLTPEAVDKFLKGKADARLSRSYVGRMRMLLADALAHAQHRGLVVRNVASLSVMPKCKPRPERRPYTADEIARLLDAAQAQWQTGGGPRQERLYALVLAGLMLGLRPGELTGLLWEDIDLDATPPTLAVTGSMKRASDGRLFRGPVKRSTNGQRTLAVPLALVTALREHRRRQAEERLALGELWKDHGLVFASATGTPLDPSGLRRTFARIAGRAGLDGFPYLMRHTVVSQLLDGGASIEEVADLTGDDPSTLYRHYRHKTRPVATGGLRMAGLLGA